MDKNNSSNNQHYADKDANDNANQKKNQYVQNEGNKNPAGKYNNLGNAGLGKGTGLSSEVNSSQNEESWQGTGGSLANEAQQKTMSQNNNSNSTKKTVSDYDNNTKKNQ